MEPTNGSPQSSGDEQAVERTSRQKNKLEGAHWRKHRLISELARGEKSMRELAKAHGVAVSAIHAFKERHSEEITEAREHLDEEFSGIWIAQKLNRLIEQAGLYEDPSISARDRETKLAVLRAAAEELGQIPNRTTIDMTLPVEVIMHVDGGENV